VDELLIEAALSTVGAGGLLWLPFFRGSGTPHRDVQARGTLIGLSTEHRRADLARALCEGLAFWARENVAALGQVTGQRASTLRLAGGANQHPLVGQLKADLLGCRTAVAPGVETSALGAALLSGLGAGLFADAGEAARAVSLPWRFYEPDETRRNRYERWYVEAYAPLCRALRPLFGRIAKAAMSDE
jgi:xylulokinase